MTQTRVFFPAGPLTLEGVWHTPDGAGSFPAVIVCHPHPLHGGAMSNSIVVKICQAMASRSIAALRFNFRGVGRSTGAYGEGLAEVEDLNHAVAYLAARVPGPCILVGYSFGAAVAARALLAGLKVAAAVLVAPPVAFMDMADLPETPGLSLMVAGDQDDFCPLAQLNSLFSRRQPPVDLKVVAGADHFFGGKEKELYQILKDYPLPPGPA